MKTIDEFTIVVKVENNNLREEHHDVSQDCALFSPLDDSSNSTTSMEALQVLKSLLKKHPWSVSDPGLPSPLLRAHHPPPVYHSSPLLMGEFDVEKQPMLTGTFQVEEHHNHDADEMKKAIIKTLLSRTIKNKDILIKWAFILLNVLLEVCQVTLAQEKNKRKIGRQTYLTLSIITSSICLIIAVIEAFREGKKFGVVWRKRGNCCWFYYPGNQGRVFGRVSLYFALVSSLIQLIVNLIAKLAKKVSVQFDYMPLLLAICYLVAAIFGSGEKTSASSISIRCNVHGLVDAELEGTFHEGHQESVAYQCPQCKMENYYELNYSS